MGLDLTLVPIHRHQSGWWLGYDRLGLDRDGLGHFIAGIEDAGASSKNTLNTKRLPNGVHFDWYGDEGCKHSFKDPYGSPLTWVTAGELAEYIKTNKRKDWSEWNRSIIKFIQVMPDETPIVLWWH